MPNHPVSLPSLHPLSWLKDHLETDASVDDILYALTDLGLEVEGIENPMAKLADFTIGNVDSAEKHPDADKLRVCQVNTKDGPTQIICGAPNARAGITVVIASPGTYVPGIDSFARKMSPGFFDNPKLGNCAAIQLFGAGREQRIYALPPYTKAISLDFEDYPFEASKAPHPCGLCGAQNSYLDEIIVDDAGGRMFVCSDTDFCTMRQADGHKGKDAA